MKKMLLVLLAIVLLPIVAMGNAPTSTPMSQTTSVSNQRQDFAPLPIPGPMPPIEVFTWAIYVDTSLPFGHIEYDSKTKRTFRVIFTNELDLGHGFVGILIRYNGYNRAHELQKIFIPNEKVFYIIQLDGLTTDR